MGGSLHDARLGFFGLSRARHGVHGLHGARRKGACTMHDKLARVSDWEFFRLNTKDMRMKITKPRECEKNHKCYVVDHADSEIVLLVSV